MTMIAPVGHRAWRGNAAPRIAAGLILGLASLGATWAARAGETRCWIDKGALVASAAFGDIAGDFLIDLAAPNSQLHDTRAGMAGLEGASATATLAIAGERIHGFTLAIADLDGRTGRFDTVITGVLGANLWRRFIVEIDPAPPCRIRLAPRHVGGRLARSLRLPLAGRDGPPLVPVTLTDGTRLRTENMAIGTAQWTSRITGAVLAHGAAPGQDRPPTVRLRALEIAGRLFEQVPAEVAAADPPGTTDAVGLAVWSSWRLRLDIQGGWIDLASAPSPAHP
jgi:hypothetical protein